MNLTKTEKHILQHLKNGAVIYYESRYSPNLEKDGCLIKSLKRQTVDKMIIKQLIQEFEPCTYKLLTR